MSDAPQQDQQGQAERKQSPQVSGPSLSESERRKVDAETRQQADKAKIQAKRAEGRQYLRVDPANPYSEEPFGYLEPDEPGHLPIDIPLEPSAEPIDKSSHHPDVPHQPLDFTHVEESHESGAPATHETPLHSDPHVLMPDGANWRRPEPIFETPIKPLPQGPAATGTPIPQTPTPIIPPNTQAPPLGFAVGGNDRGSMTEDRQVDPHGLLTAHGQLTINNMPSPFFVPMEVHGKYGTLHIDASGHWNYHVDNSSLTIQQLAQGTTVTDPILIRSTLGLTHLVTLSIHGTNDAPTITGDSHGLTKEDVATLQTTSGQLTGHDIDHGAQLTWNAGTQAGTYGSFHLDDHGHWTYTLDNSLPQTQALAKGETVVETFMTKVTDEHGAQATMQVRVEVHGTNDAPVLGGTLAGQVTEDKVLTATGPMTLTDVDHGAQLKWDAGTIHGTYGTLTVNSKGEWTYHLDNNLPVIQQLAKGDALHEQIPVSGRDEHHATANSFVTITIRGTNDAPTITGAHTGSVTEDDLQHRTADGLLVPHDIDNHHQLTWTDGTQAGTYGSFHLDEHGHWTYTLDNSLPQTQALAKGETVVETFMTKVTDEHGAQATMQVRVEVHGTNDAPVLGGTLAGQVTEDKVLTATGPMTLTDVDHGAQLKWDTGTIHGTYGTLTVDSKGEWTYHLDNNLPVIQQLAKGDALHEQIPVSGRDEHHATANSFVTITIRGTNDAPTITGAHTGSVTEDDLQHRTADGLLVPHDIDNHHQLTWTDGTQAGTYGSFHLDEHGHWTYTLDNSLPQTQALAKGETVVETFMTKVTDEHGAQATMQVRVEVHGTNDAPTVNGVHTGTVIEDLATANTAEGQLHPADIDHHAHLTWQSGTLAGTYGTFTLDGQGHWVYTLDNSRPQTQALDQGEKVTEIFTTRVTDEHGATADMQVQVHVIGTNDNPHINGSLSGRVVEDVTLTTQGNARLHDVDHGAHLTWNPVQQAGKYGDFVLNDHGHWEYHLHNQATIVQQMALHQSFTERFQISGQDEHGALTQRFVTVRIEGTNDVPTITGTHTGTVVEDSHTQHTAVGTLVPHDVDTGAVLTWSSGNQNGVYGSLHLDGQGNWVYTLDNARPITQALYEGQHVTEHFMATVTDEHGATAQQQITVEVIGTNDVPHITGTDSGTVTEDRTLTAKGDLTHGDVDRGETLTWSVANSQGQFGHLAVDQHGEWVYTLHNTDNAVQRLSQGERVTEHFQVSVTDSHGVTDIRQVTVYVRGTNDAPHIIGTATGDVKEDGPLVAHGDLDPVDVDHLDHHTWSIQHPQGHYGSITIDANGQWTYTLDNSRPDVQALAEGTSVVEHFTAVVKDNHGAQSTQVITVTLGGTNDNPVIHGTRTGTMIEDQQTTASGQLVPGDLDKGDTHTWSIAHPTGTYGTIAVDGSGHWNYQLDNQSPQVQGLRAGQSVQEHFSVTVTDNHGGTDVKEITLTIVGTNDRPHIAGVETGTVVEDDAHKQIAQGQLTSGDPDVGDAAHWMVLNSGGHYGSLSVDQTGQWTYTLDNNLPAVQQLGEGKTAQETFTVRVTDGAGLHSEKQVTVTIVGTNDRPALTGQLTGDVTEDLKVATSGNLHPGDVDRGDTHTWQVANPHGQYGQLTLDQNGHWSYQLDSQDPRVQALNIGDHLTEQFRVTVTDQHGLSQTREVGITINGTNDRPVISGTNTADLQEDHTLQAHGKLDAADADTGDVTHFTPRHYVGSYGQLVIDQTGQWSYQLDNASARVQALAQGDHVSETFTVDAVDSHGGVTHQQISVNIAGDNDGPTVAGASSGTVVEDLLTQTTGQLVSKDVDTGDTATWTVLHPAGTYGTLSVDQHGQWTFVLDNSNPAVQSLASGQTVTDHFVVQVKDSQGAVATQQVQINVVGTYDAPAAGPGGGGLGTPPTHLPTVTVTAIEDLHPFQAGQVQLPPGFGPITHWTAVPPQGAFSTLVVDPDGTWHYDLRNASPQVQMLHEGQQLQENYQVHAVDAAGHHVVFDVRGTIVGTNDNPQLVGLSTGEVTEDHQTQTGGQLKATDVDSGDTHSYSVDHPDGHYGTFSVDQTGHWSYTLDPVKANPLNPGDSIQEVFTVKTVDNHGGQAVQQVVVTVHGSADQPVITNTIVVDTKEDVLPHVQGQLTATDVDQHAQHSWSIVSGNDRYGSLTLNPDGSWSYQLDNSNPLVQQLGEKSQVTEQYTVRVTDQWGKSSTQTLVVQVAGTNDNPTIAGTSSGHVTDGATVSTSGQLQGKDIDTGDQTHFTAGSIAGQHGHFDIDDQGHWQYHLNPGDQAVQALPPGQHLTETFPVTVTDNHGASGTGQVTVTIGGSNQLPVLTGDITGDVKEDTQTQFSGTVTATDPDHGDKVTWHPVQAHGVYGDFTFRADGTWQYTLHNQSSQVQQLNEGDTKHETFVVRATDQHGGEVFQQIVVDVKGTNDLPVVSGSATGLVTEDVAHHLTDTGKLVATDPDLGDHSTWSVVNPTGNYGTMTVGTDGRWTFTLAQGGAVDSIAQGHHEQEVYTIRATDQHGGTHDFPVTITVMGTNDKPAISGDFSGSTTEDTSPSASGQLVHNDPDSGDTITWHVVGNAGHLGHFAVDPASGQWTYSLDPAKSQVLNENETRTETFTVQATDQHGATDTHQVTVTIHGTNDLPVVTGASAGDVREDTASQQETHGTLTATDADQHDTVTWSVDHGAGQYGNFTVDPATGQWHYQIDANSPHVQALAEGSQDHETFTVHATDGHGGVTDHQVTVTVHGTNDLPVVGGTDAGLVSEDRQQTSTGTLTATDIDHGDHATWSIAHPHGQYGTLSIDQQGNWNYQLDPHANAVQSLANGESQHDVFTVRVTDATGGFVDHQVTLTVLGTNDAPTISGTHTASVTEDQHVTGGDQLIASGKLDIVDPDHHESSFQAGTIHGSYGVFELHADGSWTYTADNHHPGIQSLNTGDSVIDSVPILSADGTQSSLEVTIHGADEPSATTVSAGSLPPPPPPPPPAMDFNAQHDEPTDADPIETIAIAVGSADHHAHLNHGEAMSPAHVPDSPGDAHFSADHPIDSLHHGDAGMADQQSVHQDFSGDPGHHDASTGAAWIHPDAFVAGHDSNLHSITDPGQAGHPIDPTLGSHEGHLDTHLAAAGEDHLHHDAGGIASLHSMAAGTSDHGGSLDVHLDALGLSHAQHDLTEASPHAVDPYLSHFQHSIGQDHDAAHLEAGIDSLDHGGIVHSDMLGEHGIDATMDHGTLHPGLDVGLEHHSSDPYSSITLDHTGNDSADHHLHGLGGDPAGQNPYLEGLGLHSDPHLHSGLDIATDMPRLDADTAHSIDALLNVHDDSLVNQHLSDVSHMASVLDGSDHHPNAAEHGVPLHPEMAPSLPEHAPSVDHLDPSGNDLHHDQHHF